MAFICASCFNANCSKCSPKQVLFEVAAANAPDPGESFEELRVRLELDLLPAYAAHFEASGKRQMRLHVLRALVFARSMAALFEHEGRQVDRFALQNAVTMHQFGKLKKRKKQTATLDLAVQLTPASGAWKAYSGVLATSYFTVLKGGDAATNVAKLLAPAPPPSLEQSILRDCFRLDRMRPTHPTGFDADRDLGFPGPTPPPSLTEAREALIPEAKLFIEQTETLVESDTWRDTRGDCLQVIEDLLFTWRDDLPMLCDTYFTEPPDKVPSGNVAIVMQFAETDGEPLADYQFEIKSGDNTVTGLLDLNGLLTTTVPVGNGKGVLALWRTDRGGAREFALDLAKVGVAY
jgi:hypothetical protein